MKLTEVLDTFRNDKSWNTEERNGSHRFDKEIAWIEQMVKEYAAYFDISEDEVISTMEGRRDYSWPNYYQPANFPSVDKFGELEGIFKTFEDFRMYADKHWAGYKCPKCGDISHHPQECIHRINKDEKCDWCSYGLFESGFGVIVLESGFKKIPIFKPVSKEKKE